MGELFPDDLLSLAAGLLERLRGEKMRLVTAESCTGGLVAGLLTEIAGSSDVLDRGFVTYSNAAKSDSIGVPALLIERHGAVSSEVARAMAAGALAHSDADVAVAITGVAGPGGGTPQKPVGLVHLAAVTKAGRVIDATLELPPETSRAAIRLASVRRALELVSEASSSGG